MKNARIETINVDGKIYELSISNEDECCQYCAFANCKGDCPGHCVSKINEEHFDGFWIEKK